MLSEFPIGSEETKVDKTLDKRVSARHLNIHVYCSTIHDSQAMEIAKKPHYQQTD
jgi:hypothetical protein